MKFLESRLFQFLILPISILMWFLLTDPSHGADTFLRIQLFAQALLITGLSYLIAKAMLGKASSQALYDRITQHHSTAAAIAYVGVCLLRGLILFSLLHFFATIQR